MISSTWPSRGRDAGAEVLARRRRRPGGRARASGSSAAASRAAVDDPDRLLRRPSRRARPAARRTTGRRRGPRVHRDVRAAERLAQDDGQLRHRRPRRTRAGACAPWRITPGCSWPVPGRKPGVSTSTSSGRPNVLQVRTKRAAFCARARRRARRRGSAAGWRRCRPSGRRGGRTRDTMLRAQRGWISSRLAAVDDRARRRRGRRRPCGGSAGTTSPGSPGSRLGRRVRLGVRAGVLRQVGEQVADVQRGLERRSSTTLWRRRCARARLAPPSSAASTSSPMTSFTTPGPVRNIAASFVITTKSVSAGE